MEKFKKGKATRGLNLIGMAALVLIGNAPAKGDTVQNFPSLEKSGSAALQPLEHFERLAATTGAPSGMEYSEAKKGRQTMNNLEGKPAPDFTLTGSDGQAYSLHKLKGKTVVLYFYPKDDTPGCTKEACGFRDLNADVAKTGAVVLGVSRDDGDSHRTFQTKHKLPFVLLTDADTTVHQAYGAWGKKISYGKETEGVIRSTVVIGPDGKVRKHWATVKNAEEHPAEVLKFLQNLPP